MEAKFTPGPWEYAGPYVGDGANFDDGDWGIYPPLGESGPVALVNSKANAAFIVRACNAHDPMHKKLTETAAWLDREIAAREDSLRGILVEVEISSLTELRDDLKNTLDKIGEGI